MNKEQFFKAIDNVDDKMIDELMQEEVVQPETVKNRRGFNFRLFVPCAATLVLAFGLGAFALVNHSALSPLSSVETEATEESLMPPETSDNNILPSETTDQTEETTYQAGESSDQTADQTDEVSEQTSETTAQASETDSQEDLETVIHTEDSTNVWEYITPADACSILGAFPKEAEVSQDTMDKIKKYITDDLMQEWTAFPDAALNFDRVFPLYYAEVVLVQTEEDVVEYREVYNFSDKYLIYINSGEACIGFCVVSKQDGKTLYNAAGEKIEAAGMWGLDYISTADIERLAQPLVKDNGTVYMVLRSDGEFYLMIDNIDHHVIAGVGANGEELLNEIWEAKGFYPETDFE